MHTPNLFLEIGTRIAYYNLFPPISTVWSIPERERIQNLSPPSKKGWLMQYFLKPNVFLITHCLFCYYFNVFTFKSILLHKSPKSLGFSLCIALLVGGPEHLSTCSIICSLFYSSYTRQMLLLNLPLFFIASPPFIPLLPSQL